MAAFLATPEVIRTHASLDHHVMHGDVETKVPHFGLYNMSDECDTKSISPARKPGRGLDPVRPKKTLTSHPVGTRRHSSQSLTQRNHQSDVGLTASSMIIIWRNGAAVCYETPE